MVTLQSIQSHTGLTHPFKFFDIPALWRSVPECQRIRKDGLDQLDTEGFGRIIFATIRKSVGLNVLISTTRECSW